MAAAYKGKGVAGDEGGSATPLLNRNPPSSRNPFVFWFYFTISVTVVTVLFAVVSSLFSSEDDRSWFLGLPDDLRRHYSSGRTVKVEIGAGRSPAEVFAVEAGPREGSETVVLIHGFGGSSFSFRRLLPALAAKGLRAVAVDLPGSGFSDKFVTVDEENPGGVLGVYYEIREKGLFWGFDQLIETGQIPYNGEETRAGVGRWIKVRKPIDCDAAELGRVIGQVVNSMRLGPVHLVLHDTGVEVGAMWAAAEESVGAVRSVTMVDGAAGPALPMWAVGMPMVREVALGVPIVYFGLMRWCCSRLIERAAVEAHRLLLKGKGGRRAVVGVRRSFNGSFQLGEWAELEKVRDLPVQVLWSESWSPEWIGEGRRVAAAIPWAKFVEHSGGRWPQEDAAYELAEKIAKFVKSHPKTIKPSEEEPVPEHIQKMLEEPNSGDNHHHHQHHNDHHQAGLVDQWGHDHAHAAGYMDAYGLGHGWGG